MQHFVIGIDVGGTNTDAVIINGNKVLYKVKLPTTAEPIDGIENCLTELKSLFQNDLNEISYISIGTTHFVNAILQCGTNTELGIVNVIRLCYPCGDVLEPFELFPEELKGHIQGQILIAKGGLNYDGKSVISKLDIENEIKPFVRNAIQNCSNRFVICSSFSLLDNTDELLVSKAIQEVDESASITISSEIGNLGIIERENGAILNETLKTVASNLIGQIQERIYDKFNMKCPIFMTLNDGTLRLIEDCINYPVKTFACGMTNSMRGAHFLTGIDDAIVVDIGGTSTDVGLLIKGFPQQSSIRVSFGGIITNLSTPQTQSIGLGGGSIIEDLKIGPKSLANNLCKECLSFNGKILTPTDLANLRDDINNFGNKNWINNYTNEYYNELDNVIIKKLYDLIELIRTDDSQLPIILIGGGSIIVNSKLTKIGDLNIIRINNGDVANAVGAAIAQIGEKSDQLMDFSNNQKTKKLDELFDNMKQNLINKGVISSSIKMIKLNEFPLPYIPGYTVRIICKFVGDIDLDKFEMNYKKININYQKIKRENKKSIIKEYKPMDISNDSNLKLVTLEKLNKIAIGAGILGCGGGGNCWLSYQILKAVMKKYNKFPIIIESDNLENYLNDDDYVIPLGLVGLPTVMIEKLISYQQFDKKLLKDFPNYTKIRAVMPIEIGGLNSLVPLFFSLITDLPTIEFDGMGRAFPEIQMFLPIMKGYNYLPMLTVNEFGETKLINDSKLSPKETENVVRQISIDNGCSCLLFLNPIKVHDIRYYTIDKCYTKSDLIGQFILNYSHNRQKRIGSIINEFNGYDYGTWKIVNVDRIVSAGFARGRVDIKQFKDGDCYSEGYINFQNEFIILNIDGEIRATVPDLICCALNDNGLPIMTEDLRYGLNIDIFTLKAPKELQTEEVLKYVAPCCFGYDDIEYKPSI